ncbi:MAG: S-methyl-5-thioribose-1-phosphate isomerase [SAR324 cluster bacterium]|uniref:Methylthioribose-1-phosphate isomerase n=1 Tax=SAR324 cluster bacterium TaxID=2024889 RepID=A0A7X9FT24_9DELT|nr:S-methyl-5-thioribose-1-phosphate isomerase [SAR324 cluster bacterium]
MKINGKHFRTIWVNPHDPTIVQAIDQRDCPHKFIIEDFKTPEDIITAIKDMHLRGAPLIGVAAAYGLYLAAIKVQKEKKSPNYIKDIANALASSRPTAVNLFWVLKQMLDGLEKAKTSSERSQLALLLAEKIANDEVERCRLIGEHGFKIIEAISKAKGRQVVNILTHCNAGWLACIDYGTATAPIYLAAERQIDVHVWVDETRPRNQGANLTAWELQENNIPYTLIVDNAGGHLMQHEMVDCVIVGADRVTRWGDAANKIGTYLKALAAFDNHVPFYVAVPSSSIDFTLQNGIDEITIEERSEDEVKFIHGLSEGEIKRVLICPEKARALNVGFDVTPARLISGLITERGLCMASEDSIARLFPEYLK